MFTIYGLCFLFDVLTIKRKETSDCILIKASLKKKNEKKLNGVAKFKH